jgi:hypothetical protein
MATSCYSGSPGQVCSVLPLAAFKAVAHEVWWTCAGAGLWLLRQSPGLQAFIHVLALAHRVALLRGGGYCGVLHFCGEHFFGDADAPGLVKDATLNIAFVMTMMCVAVGMGYIFLNSGIDMVHRSRRLFDTFLSFKWSGIVFELENAWRVEEFVVLAVMSGFGTMESFLPKNYRGMEKAGGIVAPEAKWFLDVD